MCIVSSIECSESGQKWEYVVATRYWDGSHACVTLGSDINASASDGWRPLHHAAENNRVRSADVLLGAGAGLQLRDNEGKTPLCIALDKDHAAVALTLKAKQNAAPILTSRG